MKVGMNQAPGPRGDTLAIDFYFLFFGRESFSLHIHATKETTSVPHKLGKRQTKKPAKSQHVKQNETSTCQLFTNSKPSLSIATEQKGRTCSGPPNRRIGTFVLSAESLRVENLANETRNALRLQDPNRHARHNDEK